jgi:hypothetical protein
LTGLLVTVWIARSANELLGVAGLAGVTATGVVVARRRRAHHEYDPDELRAKLHARLAEVPRERSAAAEIPRPGDGAERPAP